MSKASLILKVSHPFQNVRLLELPDDILNIVTNGQQSEPSLVLKSSPSVGDSNSMQQGNLHLCSTKKAWLVKQVSTSNSVYLTRLVEANGESITAFAKPSSILELHPVKATDYEYVAEANLRRLVPTITHPTQAIEQSQYSKAQLYNEIPAPHESITRIVGQCCVFDLPWSTQDAVTLTTDAARNQERQAFIPSTSLLLDAWRNIVEAATISETKITGDLEADMLLDTFSEKDDPQNILKAVARVMFERQGYFEILGLITRSSKPERQDTLNDMDLARWVGNTILKVAETRGDASLERESFETQWEDAVPAHFSKYCSVEVLGSSCIVHNDGHKDFIRWRQFNITSKEALDTDTVVKVTAPANKGKRKWHDKFAASRAAKK